MCTIKYRRRINFAFLTHSIRASAYWYVERRWYVVSSSLPDYMCSSSCSYRLGAYNLTTEELIQIYFSRKLPRFLPRPANFLFFYEISRTYCSQNIFKWMPLCFSPFLHCFWKNLEKLFQKNCTLALMF